MIKIDHKGRIKQNELVLLYDGICVFCESYMLFLMKRERKGHVRFAALQSEFGKMVLSQLESQGIKDLDSVVLIDSNGEVLIKSDVGLTLSKKMNGIWPLAQVFFVLPKGFRDRVYDWIARNRYDWFGKKEVCEIPSAADKKRFLE
jgi:predicted DCC family thiol-disulfide oxidoreductase YuxK